ncbi:diacylglycerol/lipid kinase family protein [Paenisporosarcina cavernae]|uniref:Diacylglycerol kinase family lipid kinase n=1 Tax=Paenisporosarcina cavernae TaxID=2320858 RepID=A0A385YSR9_9BACL|nr:diacylglycerol kinase family protein [Paenisporosarcina cavernae]AYC29885.1 diacylglycerol kinase family lipid kinase [Paenisporosarcina cavernae]
MKKWVFIINPSAGNGKGKRKWGAIQPRLMFEYEYYYTSGPRKAVELAKNCANNGAELVIGVGGDGTLHEIVEGVSLSNNKSCIVSAISGGSGNDFGRIFPTFSRADELNEAFKNGVQGEFFDLGRLETNHSKETFTNNAGLGFDAYIAYHVNKSSVKKMLNKIGLGKLAYTFFVVKALLHFPLFHLQVNADGQIRNFENVWLATLSNQPFFGGGMKISPTSNPRDGLVELTIVSNISRWKLLLVFGSVYLGKHTNLQAVHTFQASKVGLTTDTITYRHVDGEYAGKTRPHQEDCFSIEPRAVASLTTMSS